MQGISWFQVMQKDADVRIQEAVKDDGTKICEYDMIYVYEFIFLWVNPEEILRNENGNTLS